MPERRVTVAAAQYAPVHGQVAANLSTSLSWMRQAAGQGAKLLVLPECCLTGYLFEDRIALAELAESVDGPSVTVWRAEAERLGLTLVAGFVERAGGNLYDSALVVAPGGSLSVYRKIHLWGIERQLYIAGDKAVVADTPVGRVGLSICYDLWFPELSRRLALEGAELIASPANWAGNPRMSNSLDQHGEAMGFHLARTTACVNELPVIVADRTGSEGALTFLGNSSIVSASGEAAAGPAPAAGDMLVITEVSLGHAAEGRQSHISSRRPEIYAIGPRKDLP